MSIFNPFNELNETSRYPHARSYSSTFGQKLWDAFKAFYGVFFYDPIKPKARQAKPKPSDNFHLGIFDYCTGLILYPLTLLAFAGVREFNNTWGKIFSGIFLLALSLPRLAVALSLTLASLPFVLIAHSVYRVKGNKLKNIINDYHVEGSSLGQLLEMNETPLSTECATEKTFHSDTKKFTISFFHPDEASRRVDLTLDLLDRSDFKRFRALKRLNIGDLQGEIEREELRDPEKDEAIQRQRTDQGIAYTINY